jgi:hypothetical protein
MTDESATADNRTPDMPVDDPPDDTTTKALLKGTDTANWPPLLSPGKLPKNSTLENWVIFKDDNWQINSTPYRTEVYENLVKSDKKKFQPLSNTGFGSCEAAIVDVLKEKYETLTSPDKKV